MTKIRFAGNQQFSLDGRVRTFEANKAEEVSAEELAALGDSNAVFEVVGDDEDAEVNPLHPEIIANLPEGVTVELDAPTKEGDPEATYTVVGDNPVPVPEVDPEATAREADEDDEKGGKGGKRR